MLLNLEAFRKEPLIRQPFDFVIVRDFLARQAKQAFDPDFPRISKPGSFPISELSYGPTFARLLAELCGAEFKAAVSEKFALDLSARPIMVTVRGRCQKSEGKIHTDTPSKIISVLLYLNDRWDHDGGRLRLVRTKDNLESFLVEIPPEWGVLVAFRRADNSFHGHKPFEGERRVIQVNWVSDQRVADRELRRHRRSARIKRFLPFAWSIGY